MRPLHAARAVVLVLLQVMLPATAWISTSQSSFSASIENIQQQQHGNYVGHPQAALGFVWNYPSNASDNTGLGGGITWAWDDALCPKLLPLFTEDLFFYDLVSCYDLKAAMHRAFDSWAANHRAISFVDVTEACRTAYGVVAKTCPLAEVWVTARPDGEFGPEAARATPKAVVNTGKAPGAEPFRYTNGRYATRYDLISGRHVPQTVIETLGGVVDFSLLRADGVTPICWYLDSTFCSSFHELKKLANPETVWAWGLSITIVVTLAVGMCTLLELCGYVVAPCLDTHRMPTCTERASKSVSNLARCSVCGMALRLILIVTPWLFWGNIFVPCFSCYDFEAAATHEVGHLLGLAHPDRAGMDLHESCASGAAQCGDVPPVNSRYISPPASNSADESSVATWFVQPNCLYSFDGVVPEPSPTPRPSVMISFTQHNPTVCLTVDDLEGLNALYPDCSHSITTPVCFKSPHNIGYVRLGAYTLFPIMLAVFFATIVGGITQRHQIWDLDRGKRKIVEQLAELRQVAQLVRDRSNELHIARQQERVARQREEQVREELDVHRAIEASRQTAHTDEERRARAGVGHSRGSSPHSSGASWIGTLFGGSSQRSGEGSPSSAPSAAPSIASSVSLSRTGSIRRSFGGGGSSSLGRPPSLRGRTSRLSRAQTGVVEVPMQATGGRSSEADFYPNVGTSGTSYPNVGTSGTSYPNVGTSGTRSVSGIEGNLAGNLAADLETAVPNPMLHRTDRGEASRAVSVDEQSAREQRLRELQEREERELQLAIQASRQTAQPEYPPTDTNLCSASFNPFLSAATTLSEPAEESSPPSSIRAADFDRV